jgi:hypothetical protein
MTIEPLKMIGHSPVTVAPPAIRERERAYSPSCSAIVVSMCEWGQLQTEPALSLE